MYSDMQSIVQLKIDTECIVSSTVKQQYTATATSAINRMNERLSLLPVLGTIVSLITIHLNHSTVCDNDPKQIPI